MRFSKLLFSYFLEIFYIFSQVLHSEKLLDLIPFLFDFTKDLKDLLRNTVAFVMHLKSFEEQQIK